MKVFAILAGLVGFATARNLQVSRENGDCSNSQVPSVNGCIPCGGSNQPPCIMQYDSNDGCKNNRVISPFDADQPKKEDDAADTLCLECGGSGQPACKEDKCDTGKPPYYTSVGAPVCCSITQIFDGSKCVTCGTGSNDKPPEPPCRDSYENAYGCKGDRTVSPPIAALFLDSSCSSSPDHLDAALGSGSLVCENCGKSGQPVCVRKPTDEGDLPVFSCDSTNGIWEKNYGGFCCWKNQVHDGSACVSCGLGDQPACRDDYKENGGCKGTRVISPYGASPPETMGDVRDAEDEFTTVCVACGGANQPACGTHGVHISNIPNDIVPGMCDGGVWTIMNSETEKEEPVCCSESQVHDGSACVSCGLGDEPACRDDYKENGGCKGKRVISPYQASPPQNSEQVKNAVCVACGGANQPACGTHGDISTSDGTSDGIVPGMCDGGVWTIMNSETEKEEPVCCSKTQVHDGSACVPCGLGDEPACRDEYTSNGGCKGKRVISPYRASPPQNSEQVKDAVCVDCGGEKQPACGTHDSNLPICDGAVWTKNSGTEKEEPVCCPITKNWDDDLKKCSECGKDYQPACVFTYLDNANAGCKGDRVKNSIKNICCKATDTAC